MRSVMSLPYLDRLDSERLAVFDKLKNFTDHFVLAGGTAIMLQIGHRKSVDFDCFTIGEKLPQNLPRKMKKVFGVSTLPYVNTSELCLFTVGKGTYIHFVAYPYPHLKTPLQTQSISLVSLTDLAANKAYTIGRRGAWRDYVDLFFLLKWHYFTLEEIITLAENKFAGEFHDKLFLEQLTYFDDIEILPTAFLKESYTDNQIKSYFSDEVAAYLKNILPV